MLVTALEAYTDVPDMKTVTEHLLHEELKIKDRNASSTTLEGIKEKAMVVKQKKRGPKCHFYKKVGHMQWNCYK